MPDRDDRPPPLWVRARMSPVTSALVLVCVALFLLTTILACVRDPEPQTAALRSLWEIDNEFVFDRLGALNLPRVWIEGEWWRVLTAGLLHGSWLHLVLNMIALWSLGEWIERTWGSWTCFLAFWLSVSAGSLASIAWCESMYVVGASGGILGMAGFLWVTRRWGTAGIQRRLEPISARRLGIMIGLCVVLGAIVPMIAQAGHLGGLVAGILLGIIEAREWRGRARALGWFAPLAFLLILLVASIRPAWRANFHAYGGFYWLAQVDHARALASFEEGLKLDPENHELRNTVAYELAVEGVGLERAKQLAEDALAASPEDYNYLDTMGWIYCRSGDPDEGLVWLQQAVDCMDEPIEEILTHVNTCRDVAVSPVGER